MIGFVRLYDWFLSVIQPDFAENSAPWGHSFFDFQGDQADDINRKA